MAISYAAYRVLLNLFPARAGDFTALITAMGYDPNDTTTDPASPAGVGNQAAAAVLVFRATEGSNQAGGYADTSGYVPVNTPDQVNDRSIGSRCAIPTAAAVPSSRSSSRRIGGR